MKKIAMAVLAAAVFGASVFAEVKVSFENKVFEDGVIYFDNGDESATDFPALKERMAVQLDSDKVDAYVKATVSLDDFGGKHFGVAGEINDWWVEFRPVDIVTLCLHDNIYSDGSYLPIYDDNLAGGNIGSDGFTVVFRPEQFNKAFRIGFTVPFDFDEFDEEKNNRDVVNYFNGKKEDGEHDNFHFGAGIIFSLPTFQIGATFQNIICSDDRLIGVSLNFPGTFVEGLTFAVGYTNDASKKNGFGDILDFGQEVGVTGENVINAAISYEKDAFSCAVETLISTEDDATVTPFNSYVGVSVGYAATDALSFGAFGKFLLTTDSDVLEDNAMGFGVTADYAVNKNNTVGVEFDYNMCGDVSAIKVPVYWKYNF